MLKTADTDSMARKEGLKMARYSMGAAINGTHHPILWDKKEFNLGITYNNGIIAITEPGYYRITATFYTKEKHPLYVDCRLYINGYEYLQTTSTWASPGFMHGIKHLDVFDTIHISRKNSPKFQGGSMKNYFTIEKL